MELLEEELISLGIGGMASQFAQMLQSAFGSRMVAPTVARRLNLKHVRGMLLYGPPGSGKTLIARSISKLLNAKEPLIINGPDVLNAFQGVSEEKIRSLFKAAVEDENRYGARSDLHIIIFDEIDSIAKEKGNRDKNRKRATTEMRRNSHGKIKHSPQIVAMKRQRGEETWKEVVASLFVFLARVLPSSSLLALSSSSSGRLRV